MERMPGMARRPRHPGGTVTLIENFAGPDGSRARNGHTTAPFAGERQSFLDNVIAGLGQTGAWNDPASE
jgi:hypothetical protein